jgi:hypothetical protein
MLTLLGAVAGAFVAASLPFWLPPVIVRLRMRIFTRINGAEAIAIPGDLVSAERFKWLYSHPAVDGRSRGAVLSDLFWYWLSPGPEMHQEHLEPGERYEQVAATTRRILTLPRHTVEALAQRCVACALGEHESRRAQLVRLRDFAMPIWADLYYELVFAEPCPPDARRLIVGNADDVVTALKCCGLRHMSKRRRLTEFLVGKLDRGEVPHALPASLSIREKALYLQGVFFNTAIVQMSEATAHLLLALAQHPDMQTAVVSEPEYGRYLDRVINETLRVYPLFGIAHRITSSDIVLDERTTIAKGAVVCFNHPDYHRVGYQEPERFDPNRWLTLSPRQANYIPFGVSANRPCPAQAIALMTLRVAAREVLRRFSLSSSVSHTRSLPNRGPCLLTLRGRELHPSLRGLVLAFMRSRDRWEDMYRSVVQLILGSYMVWDARRQSLCTRYFEQADGGSQDAEGSRRSRTCPIGSHAPERAAAGTVDQPDA